MKVFLEQRKHILNLYCKLYTIQNQSKLFKPLDNYNVILLTMLSAV